MVAYFALGQLNRKSISSLSPFSPEILVSRDGFGSPVCLVSVRSFLRLRRNLVLTLGIPPAFRDDIHTDRQLPSGQSRAY